MRNVILMALLIMASSSAMAEWVKLGVDGDRIYYADLASKKTTGSMTKMWLLDDYQGEQTISKYKFLSTVILAEFDCTVSGKFRALETYFKAGNLAKGEPVVQHIEPTPWLAPPFDAPVLAVWKFACENQ